jgi:hypothetical protein
VRDNPPMKISHARLALAGICTAWMTACHSDSSHGPEAVSTSPSAPQPAAKAAPASPVAVAAAAPPAAPCGRDFTEPVLMQRAGRAHVVLKGAGFSLDAMGAPAVCGPLYNTDVKPLNVHAGDGLQFEACLPQGVVQITSEGRTPGAQRVHTGQQPSGAEVTFEARDGDTYSVHGAATDSIVFSPDLWQVDATIVLHAIDGDGLVAAQVSIDCAAQGL